MAESDISENLEDIYISKLKQAHEIEPDKHDGSYEMVREIVNKYKEMKNNNNLENVDYHDADAIFFMTTFCNYNKRLELLNNCHLSDKDKTYLKEKLNEIHANILDNKYSNPETQRSQNFGMFSEIPKKIFKTLEEQSNSHEPTKNYIDLCIDVYDKNYDNLENKLKTELTNIRMGIISQTFHCLQPFDFPILNGIGMENIKNKLGIKLKRKISDYFENKQTLDEFRDNMKFEWKNYRILDIVLRNSNPDIILQRTWYVGGCKYGNVNMFESFLKNEIFGIGYTYLGDLKENTDDENIKTKIKENEDESKRASVLNYIKTFKNLKKGNIIVLKGKISIKDSVAEILDIGIVDKDFKDGYDFDMDLGHTIPVKWLNSTPLELNNSGLVASFISLGTLGNLDNQYKTLIMNEMNKRGDSDIFIMNEMNEKKNNEYKGNFIFYGAPGSGKSYNVKKVAEDKEIFDYSKRILFHPEYSYSDFVGQILPSVDSNNSKKLEYKFNAGPFTKILADALSNDEKNYCLIIEEINRGNASAIFGDIFQLMDRRAKEETNENGHRKGDSEYAIRNDDIVNWFKQEKIPLDNLIKDGDNFKIYIPHNLSIYATMNSNDQNVFVLDTAFKRRWKFRYVPVEFEENDNREIPLPNNAKMTWKEFVEKLNNVIPDLNNGMNGDDKLIGQYFVSEEELSDIDDFAYKIFLYLWDDVAKSDRYSLFEEKIGDQKINTLEKLIKAYKDVGLKVFKKEIFEISDIENEEVDDEDEKED